MKVPAAQEADEARGVCRQVGLAVRRARESQGLTREQLATRSGVSQRYLAQLELGDGNPTIAVLHRVAGALEASISTFLMGDVEHADDRLLGMMQALSGNGREALQAFLESQLADQQADRRHVALVGLRGAGKSTLGSGLATLLGLDFVELRHRIEEAYGAGLSTLFDLSGQAAYQRYEAQCLTDVLAESTPKVIATGGGIVTNANAYGHLLQKAHTVWLRASPQDHMERVVAQGDVRPMRHNPAAMTDLQNILDARAREYARAHATVDTHACGVPESLARLGAAVDELRARNSATDAPTAPANLYTRAN